MKAHASRSVIFSKAIQPYLHLVILGILVLSFIIYYTSLSFLRYDHFYTGRLDLGNMTQTVWNTAHGRWFQFTDPEGTEVVSRLAYHADFILMLFAPFYWIWESPKVLLLAQVAILGSGAFFVYAIANKIIKSKNISLALAFAYLINPSLSWSVLFDFHAVVLATTFLLGTIYFFLQKKYRWFFIFALFAALTKEQVWFIIALFGPLLFFFHKKKLFGISVFLCCLGMFYYLLWHAIPHAASSQEHFALSYFNGGGDSFTDVIKHSLTTPVETARKLFEREKVEYLVALYMPLGYLSVLSPFWLIFSAADFALNLSTDKVELHQIYYHYTATITPFIFLSAIYGVRVLNKVKVHFLERYIVVYVLSFSLLAAYTYGPLLGTLDPNDDMVYRQEPYHREILAKLNEIPTDKSVASSNEVGAHLSHRENIYTLGVDVTEADYVVFYIHDPDPSEEEFNDELKQQLRGDKNYQTWYDQHDVVIFKKSRL